MFSSKSIIFTLLATASTAFAGPLLPDMIVDSSVLDNNFIDTSTRPGRVLLRFESSLANIGPGEFLLLASDEESSPGFEYVDQYIYQENDEPQVPVRLEKVFYKLATEARETDETHMHSFDWVAFRIREILPEDGVGPILRSGQKPFVRLTSSRSYDSSVPNYTPSNERISIRSPYRRQGVSVGWTDIYNPQFELQWVDVTGLKRGEYWLEVAVNVADNIVEADTSNNTGRMKVTLDSPLLPLFETHRADIREFGRFDLSELLRVIQIFNTGSYGCAENTEDGFELNGADNECQPHSSDYQNEDWSISLSELLRGVQLYNAGGYLPCEQGEDGFCPQAF